MWAIRLKIYEPDEVVSIFCNKHDLTAIGYPLSFEKIKGKLYLNAAGKLIGSEKGKQGFFKDFKKSQFITKLEVYEDFFVFQLELIPEVPELFQPEFIYVEPIRIDHKFIQYYHIASWDREKLSKLLDLKIPNADIKILSFKEEKIKDISITKPYPALTDKQKRAFKTAFESGYYEFPRKTELKELAKTNKISLSTYQAHLRKAEKKIMEFFYHSV